VCAEHAAALARAGAVALVPAAGELEGAACAVCELERFALSPQSATSLVIEALQDGDPVLGGQDDAAVPVDMVAVRRLSPTAFLLTFQEGSTYQVTVTAGDPVAVREA
jgi:hypothetical protein